MPNVQWHGQQVLGELRRGRACADHRVKEASEQTSWRKGLLWPSRMVQRVEVKV